MKIDVNLDAQELTQALNRLIALGRDLDPILMAVGNNVVMLNEERHEREINPDGSAWAPLTPWTLKFKKGKRKLVDTGQMLQLNVQLNGNSVEVGTADEKAIWHHFGTDPYRITAKNKNALGIKSENFVFGKSVNHPGLPAREILGVNAQDREEILDNVSEMLLNALDGKL